MKPAEKFLFEGELLTVAEIGARVGVAPAILRRRLRAGEPPELAFTGARRCRKYAYEGRELTLAQIAGESGLPLKTLADAVYAGRVKPGELEEYVQSALLRREGQAIQKLKQRDGLAPEMQIAVAIAGKLFGGSLLEEAGFRETQKGVYEFGAELCRYILRMQPGDRAELRAYSRGTEGCMLRRKYEIRSGVPVEVRT